ncbi:MAG: DUF4384 domain-containing protein [Myxococcales bacterium]|nr:DUF4384 domain-containing protein [Myxococcota bacterium]MDW8283039.1 DUF4384 domain-containing protein [Myxococcales bacterium]
MVQRCGILFVALLLLGCGGRQKTGTEVPEAPGGPEPRQAAQGGAGQEGTAQRASEPGDATQGGPGQTPARAEPIHVSLQVEALTKKGQHFIQSGETLRSGDRMALRVEVDRPAYVYIGQADSAGEPTLLFPRSGDERLQPGAPVRIPPPGQWFRLDKQTGEENLFVYASAQPIAPEALRARMQTDAESARAFSRTAAQDKGQGRGRKAGKGRSSSSDAPGGLTVGTRGLELDSGAGPQVLVDDKGVSTLRFTVRHTP